MRNKINIFILFGLTVLLFTSCKKDKVVVDLGLGYFPSNVGHYCIYQVDSIVYDDFTQTKNTYSFQIKEIVESNILDNAGKPAQRLERYYRKTDTDSWIIHDVWISSRDTKNAIKTEENIKYIKLSFPVTKGKTWNGNIYNTIGEWDFKYNEINKSSDLNGNSFDSTLTVIQIADSSLITKKDYREMYAKNVGLIYKHYIDVEDKSKAINLSKPFWERITSGVDYTYTLISIGY